MAIPRNCFAELFEAILLANCKRAKKYISEREVVKATFQGKRRKGSRTRIVIVTVGAPNYEERRFIKKEKLAGRFPPKGIMVKG